MEVWKDVVGYEGIYKVSSQGNVLSLDRTIKMCNGALRYVKEKMMSTKERKGYPRVILSKNGIVKHKSVHQLVAESFLGYNASNRDFVIDHINNIKTDNRVENLQIVTVRVNVTKDRRRNIKLPTGVTITPSGKYRSAYYVNGINKHIGTFTCPTSASFAYQKAIK